MPLAEKKRFIVVYLEGLNGSYGKPTWHNCRANATIYSKANDVYFISALIDEISSSYPVDLTRIYASGTSNGGFMVLRLAVELPNRIAAVAAVAAAMPDSSACSRPTHPVSVLCMNGTHDNHMPYNGGMLSYPPKPEHGTLLSTKASVQLWTAVDQTDTIPVVYHFPDLDPTDGGAVTRFSYLNGFEKTEVVLYQITGGGHSAPSIQEHYSKLFESYFNQQNHDIEMTTEVWKFFKHKKLRQSLQ